jgi:hypothetical protein
MMFLKRICFSAKISAAFIFFVFPFFSLSAILVGNPGQPGLLCDGIFYTPPTWWSFRVAYFDDYIYHERFRDEFKIDDIPRSKSNMKLSTFAAQVSLNFRDRIDIYGIIGSSKIKIDDEIFSKRRLCGGLGTKFVIFHEKNFFIGADFKYFESDQKPAFFVVDGLSYDIESDFRLKYHEIQAALGCTYRIWIFAPYIAATYLIPKIEPHPHIAVVRLPDMDESVDVTIKSVSGMKRWGMALGLSVVDNSKASLAFEWRLFNQYAINVNAEVRF